MKNIIYIVLILVLASSCNSMDNDDPILYDGISRIYFKNDSIKINLAELLVQEHYKIKIPVKVMGISSKNERSFQVELLDLVTNEDNFQIKEGSEIDKLSDNFIVMPDSLASVMWININREAIGLDKVYELNLKIKENNYFKNGVIEQLKAKIIVINFLEKPDWWEMSGLKSNFNPIMLSKLFEIYGKSPIVAADVWADYMGMMAALKKVSDWLDANPKYGVQFNDADKKYFEMFA